MKTVSALTFRRRFGSVLDDVVKRRQPVTVTRANRPLVVLVPAADYEGSAGASAGRAGRLRLAAERLAEWRERHADRLKTIDTVALVRASRASR